MDQFINSLPKTLVAIVAMVVGLLVMRAINPPTTICDAQLELFRDSQKKFLYPDAAVNGITKSSMIRQFVDTCKASNTPGACFELFQGLKKMAVDLGNIPEQCAEATGDEKQLTDWLWSSLRLMTLIAWGDKPPANYLQKSGWFDSSELSLFCELRRQSIRIYGNDTFRNWQETQLKSFPLAENLTREQVWSLSILSTPCDLYR